VITVEFAFFAIAALLVLVGGVVTVAARNPIRGALGLMTTIIGIAAMYLLLSAEFLAAIQILVYAGAVVVLFLFVIMLLGPSATSGRDARTAIPRYLGASIFLGAAGSAVFLVTTVSTGVTTALQPAPAGLGTIEGIGRELFTTHLVPFELSGALLLVAVVGAVAVARGRQPDPTLLTADDPDGKAYAGQGPVKRGLAKRPPIHGTHQGEKRSA
jgi:NADH-quinone oxidoreductase subunit J